MSDFFGGILDSMRGAVSSADDFFGHSLGTAVARGVAQGSAAKNSGHDYESLYKANRLAEMSGSPASFGFKTESRAPRWDNQEAKPEDYTTVEQQWLQRLHRFSQVDSEIQSGKVNEGPPR